jgi:GxxExxY protein
MDGEEGTTKYAEGAKFGEIIVEIKAVKQLADEHRAQTINYLKATGKQLGLLVNFGHYPKLEHERFVHQALSRIPRISRM